MATHKPASLAGRRTQRAEKLPLGWRSVVSALGGGRWVTFGRVPHVFGSMDRCPGVAPNEKAARPRSRSSISRSRKSTISRAPSRKFIARMEIIEKLQRSPARDRATCLRRS